MPLDEQALSEFHDGINVVLDLTDAYRAALLERGYSPTAAEMMTIHYHDSMWRNSPQATQGGAQ